MLTSKQELFAIENHHIGHAFRSALGKYEYETVFQQKLASHCPAFLRFLGKVKQHAHQWKELGEVEKSLNDSTEALKAIARFDIQGLHRVPEAEVGVATKSSSVMMRAMASMRSLKKQEVA